MSLRSTFLLLLWPLLAMGEGITPLKAHRLGRPFAIGTAVNVKALLEDPTYALMILHHFSSVTAETEMKIHDLQPAKEYFDFGKSDRLMEFAQTHGLKVRGHSLVDERTLPSWLADGQFSPEELRQILENYIKTVVTHYRQQFPGVLTAWDVVNEAYDYRGRLKPSIWSKIGSASDDYIRLAFQWAHEADPEAKLFYNDHGAEGLNGKSHRIFRALQQLRAEGIPVHGIGFQMHMGFLGGPTQFLGNPSPAEVGANMERLARLGLEIHITEMDVPIFDFVFVTQSQLRSQARIYREMLAECLKNESCTSFTTWGFTDRYSWIPSALPGWGSGHLFDRNYAPKPAFHAILELLQ